jgi:membrane-bound lytic murein transglycosylase
MIARNDVPVATTTRWVSDRGELDQASISMKEVTGYRLKPV